MTQQLNISSDDAIRRIKFSNDGSRFLAISRRQIVSYLVDGSIDGTYIAPLGFFDAAYVSNDRIVASTWLHAQIPERVEALALYDLGSGHLLTYIETDDVRSVCVDSKRGRILAGSLSDMGGCVETYDFNLKRLSHFASKEMPFDMVIDHSGNHVAIASIFFELWDTVGDPYPRFQDYPPESDCTGYICEVCAVDITPDGRYALGGLYGGKSACFLVAVATGSIIGWYGPDGSTRFIDTMTAALSPDGQYVAIAIRDATTVDIYRVSDNTIYHQFEVEKCETIAFSPLGNLLALGVGNLVSLRQFIG